MIAQVITLLIYVLVFAIAAYGLWWVCQKFTLPQPVLWICGVLLLIVILLALSGELTLPGAGTAGTGAPLFRRP